MSFETIRGTRDIPPAEQPVWDLIRKAIRVTAETFCYRRVDTPIIESWELFQRGIGKLPMWSVSRCGTLSLGNFAIAIPELLNAHAKQAKDLVKFGVLTQER